MSIRVSGDSEESRKIRRLTQVESEFSEACIQLVFFIRGIVNLLSVSSVMEGFSVDNYTVKKRIIKLRTQKSVLALELSFSEMRNI